MLQRLFIIAFLSLYCPVCASAQTGNAGYVCPKCGHFEWTPAKIKAHTCSYHGFNCATTTYSYVPVVTKTAEQIRAEREKKDLQEAAEDATDKGDQFLKKQDWATAINYYKVALEYVPGFEDAVDNLKKAQVKLDAENQRKREEEEASKKAEIIIPAVTIPSHIADLMKQADAIIVPPPSWESTIHEQAAQIRLGQDGDKNLWLAADMFMSAFDESAAITETETIHLKLLMIGAKSTNAAQNEADIVVFKQTAWYELALKVLKDKKQAPLLIAVIKALREKRPVPPGTSPDLLKLAQATQNSSLGNSSVHVAMNAMLSPESMSSFFQTAKMEALSLVSDKIKDAAGEWIGKRFYGLKDVNDKINTCISIADKEQEPWLKTILRDKIAELENKLKPTSPVPEEIMNVMNLFK